jgi:serine/threonine protein kinase
MAERNVLLKNVKHPFLVGLHYSFQTTEKLYFVLDFVNGGEVSFVIKFSSIDNRKIAWSQKGLLVSFKVTVYCQQLCVE